ncbi:hypothetical protein ACVNHC_24395 [Pannonibacter sp. Q-1]
MRSNLPEKENRMQWVQTERAAHEAWMKLTRESPLAAAVMHALVMQMGEHNAVVISQKSLAALVDASERGVRNAIALLNRRNWIEVRQIGSTGTVNAYVVNDRVAWTGKRDGIRFSLFTAKVIVSESEQPDRDALGRQEPLQQIPGLYRGEQQLPTGDGLPPPAEPPLPGFEPDLPARQLDIEDFTK